MSEGNKVEMGSEKIPTKQEILDFLGIDADKCAAIKELSDENGLYFFDFKLESRENGEVVEYEYRRKGEFSDAHKSSGTSIYETIYDEDGDFVKFPEHIAEYNHESGEWVKV